MIIDSVIIFSYQYIIFFLKLDKKEAKPLSDFVSPHLLGFSAISPLNFHVLSL